MFTGGGTPSYELQMGIWRCQDADEVNTVILENLIEAIHQAKGILLRKYAPTRL